MKNYRIVLCDEEEKFVVPFMDYINRNARIPMVAMAFTEMQTAMDYIREHSVDLIVSGYTEPTFQECVNGKTVLWLVDSGQEQEQVLGQGYKIERYLSAASYVRQMIKLLQTKQENVPVNKTVSCLAVYSPIGRCGVTRLAHALCHTRVRDIAAGGCLYLGWETFAEEWDEGLAMEELLYYIKQRTESISEIVKKLAQQTDGYDVVKSAGDYQQLRELTHEDVHWFFQTIQEEGVYDYLVADIGSASLTELDTLMEFDGIYILIPEEAECLKKQETFIRQLMRQGCWKELYQKCYPVSVTFNQINLEEQAEKAERQRRQGTLPSFDETGEWKHGAGANMQETGDSDTEYIRWDDRASRYRDFESYR